MRGDNAGETTADTNAAALTLPAELAPPAAQLLTCARCGAQFVQDFEEKHCGSCVAWFELQGRR